MNIKIYTVLIMVLLLLAGCSGQSLFQPAETATPLPPTPTETPKYALECTIDTQQYGFGIKGETGPVTESRNSEVTNIEYATSGQQSGLTINVNRDLDFENTQHKYHLEGTIKLDMIANEVTYDITATSDVFGDSPQTCHKP